MQDEKLRKQRAEGRDVCRQAYQDQYQGSQQADQETFAAGISSMQQLSGEIYKKAVSINESIVEMEQSKSVTGASSDAIGLRKSSMDANSRTKLAPRDPRPDSRAISMSRLDTTRKAFMDRVAASRAQENRTSVQKEQQMLDSAQVTATARNRSALRKSQRYH